ncbi:uncharacterized protein KY384_007079 [Bacidia gigantensis]|uniref:uncharacterized protein n=1 Tax=Bacidia gigantensis TaxID=2732470 RepID=UPI001D05B284|nr:uncharacterized protein KY384_007079 [Bacidia gigantensis]KAG8528162.1 hypothetical protein KY384_007079 [Bacidia gigantensis]
MTDPFSIAAATVGTIDVVFRVSKSIKKTLSGASSVDQDVADLLDQIEDLLAVNANIRDILSAPELLSTLSTPVENGVHLEGIWVDLERNTQKILGRCGHVLHRLDNSLKTVKGLERPNDNVSVEKGATWASEESKASKIRHAAFKRVNSIRVQLRKESKESEFQDLRQQLANNQNGLGTCLAGFNVRLNTKSHHSMDEVKECMENIRSQLSSSRQTAKPIPQLRNQYFQAPVASNMFTGREDMINELGNAFALSFTPLDIEASDGSSSSKVPVSQKRFIIFGLGGSGKTEFCRRFAEVYQRRFWGVFWIDASSDDTAKHSFQEISKIGGVDTNINAAKTWLSGIEDPWLLVIDNADDPNIPIQDYFPGGENGCVLVTTRNPLLKKHGTAGERCCELGQLEDEDAEILLLKHAQESEPWTLDVRRDAAHITEALGYLPLALVFAGDCIAKGLTSRAKCVEYLDGIWDRIREESTASGQDVDETQKNVLAPYDAFYRHLDRQPLREAKDAIQILKLFSLLHHENIRFDFLMKAAENPPSVEARLRQDLEEQQRIALAKKGKTIEEKSKPWRRVIRDRFIQAVTWCTDRGYPVLPEALRNGRVDRFSVDRLRAALVKLTSISLVTHRRVRDSDVYSMHPLVHKWVRERPQMKVGERAVWCQAAANMLSQCIPLPPFGESPSDMELRRRLLPHLDAVQRFQEEIRLLLASNRRRRALSWLLIDQAPSMTRQKALQYGKFSRVYAECARLHDAKNLQVQVKDYVTEMLGLEDERTVLIFLALAGTYGAMTHTNDAAALMNQALSTCKTSLGENHPRTLKVMDELGKCEVHRGRYKGESIFLPCSQPSQPLLSLSCSLLETSDGADPHVHPEALKLHVDALAGMKIVLPLDHTDVLLATDHLGLAHQRYFRFDTARELHKEAIAGLTRTLGYKHPDTVAARENLAITYLEVGLESLSAAPNLESLRTAQKLELEILEERRQSLGREHHLTLWTITVVARIDSALGRTKEAEKALLDALPIGIRNLPEDHMGFMLGKTQLAQIYVRQERYQEAEELFEEVIAKTMYRNSQREEGESPDQIMAMWSAAECYQIQRKFVKSDNVLKDIWTALIAIGGTQHPFAERVQKMMAAVQRAMKEGEGQHKETIAQ